jgi:Domain of unknown function (DUF3291)
MDEGNGLTGYELAQLNIGRMLAPLDSPQLKGFADGLDHINTLAEAAPGFLWRLKDEETDDATSFRIFDDDWVLVNMSVWQSPEALRTFVYDDAHRSYLRRRREWFERLDEAVTVLWWVPAGHRPNLAEARDRLEHLRKHGTTQYAFALADKVPAPAAGTDYAPHA